MELRCTTGSGVISAGHTRATSGETWGCPKTATLKRWRRSKPAEMAGTESSKVPAAELSAVEPATAESTTMESSSATTEMPTAPTTTTAACPRWLTNTNKSGDY